MKVELIQYTEAGGWQPQSFPDFDSEQTLVLVFASPSFIDKAAPIENLAKHYPKSKIIGCSSAGEIMGPNVYDASIVVAIIKFDKTKIKITKAPLKSMKDSLQSGKEVSKSLTKKDLQCIFVLSKGLDINGSELVRGLNEKKEKHVVITGGLAGDGSDFKKTWLIYDGKILTDAVVAVGLYGDAIKVGHASRGGWDIFGPERQITRSVNNILYELDGKPALDLYKEYLGELSKELPASGLLFPLSIREHSDDSKHLVRTRLAVDEEARSLTFAGDVPVGYLAQLMRANFERLILSASEAGEVAMKKILSGQNNSDQPVLAVAVSCVGRKLLLGARIDEETEGLLSILPKNAKQFGYYSYGELSPYATGNCDLHNQTMTLTIFHEDI